MIGARPSLFSLGDSSRLLPNLSGVLPFSPQNISAN
jgi:hypothetical protein